ncbi:FAD/NAD(P)-binding domain-containing protein [Polyplosphaeria fusca]|uniref:FAD/NAD(P)-binding domain-containing protein n=1 Tax=Polyplosphaeria fusca TaxID=682080 RepID=A0A9P4QUS4_9PLEO|nr:FAD/NAD(P)-binding domain-containing protein [Polyplosphaeria fusca]
MPQPTSFATNPPTVAVIGLEPARRRLRRPATGFDANHYVGGLWKYTTSDHTSVMQSTVVDISKERGCFTDFPFGEGVRTHPAAEEVWEYLEAYKRAFGLGPRCRLGCRVRGISWRGGKWVVDNDAEGGRREEFFDKVVMATGINSQPNVLDIEGVERFEGVCLHSRGFKRPKDFDGKRVMIVGLGNTAADTATQLVGHASRIWISNRHRSHIIPRTFKGQSIDHGLTHRVGIFNYLFWYYAPSIAEKIDNYFITKLQTESFDIQPERNISPPPGGKAHMLIISDNLVDSLQGGDVESVAGIKKFASAKTVELLDGTQIGVDVVIWCTGYKSDFSLLDPKFDPTKHSNLDWHNISGAKDKPSSRLYQNIFSLEKPDSLAFVGTRVFPAPAFQTFDLASMALAQIWKGNAQLPPYAEMERWADNHLAWVCNLAKSGGVFPNAIDGGPWQKWVNDAAGTGVNEKLGYGLEGWRCWWRDRKLCKLLMDGTYSPHMFRLFEGRRKEWKGAMEAIEKANEVVRTGIRQRTRKVTE